MKGIISKARGQEALKVLDQGSGGGVRGRQVQQNSGLSSGVCWGKVIYRVRADWILVSSGESVDWGMDETMAAALKQPPPGARGSYSERQRTQDPATRAWQRPGQRATPAGRGRPGPSRWDEPQTP